MNTDDQWIEELGSCPCKDGKVVVVVVTPNNMYSKTTRSVKINCDKCAAEWSISEQSLILKSSENEWRNLSHQLSEARHKLRPTFIEAVDRHFVALAATTRKAEWEELERLGLASCTLPTFRKHRQGGKSVGEAALVPQDKKKLEELGMSLQGAVKLREALQHEKQLAEAVKAAETAIIRQPIDGFHESR